MEFEKTAGTLSDTQIEKYSQNGYLIVENFNKRNIKQACYELTAGSIYYDLSNHNQRIDLSSSNFSYILMKPKQSVIIITHETLEIPDNCLGRILTKGKLFSIGLSPVNTYADPGFSGKLGIIFHNNSTNYLKIKPQDAIAKIEFSVLSESVERPYNGQHGYETQIWPIPVEYTLSKDEISNDSRIEKDAKEISRMYGDKFSSVITRLLSVEKRLFLCCILYCTIMLFVVSILIYLGKMSLINSLVTFVVGLIASALSAFIAIKLEKG